MFERLHSESEVSMKVKGIKGFGKGMMCNKYNGSKQYAESTVYEEGLEPECCSAGMHFVENPLDVFSYYAPGDSEYAEVEAIGDVARHDEDSKISTNKLKIGLKVDLKGVINAGVDFILEKSKVSKDAVVTSDDKFNKTPAQVEQSIRRAIEICAYRKGTIERVTNSVFIVTAADEIRLKMKGVSK